MKTRSCPFNKCQGRLRCLHGKYGKFWGCSKYPKCNFTQRYEYESDPMWEEIGETPYDYPDVRYDL